MGARSAAIKKARQLPAAPTTVRPPPTPAARLAAGLKGRNTMLSQHSDRDLREAAAHALLRLAEAGRK